MKREHYRPFDPVAAQAGAPYGHLYDESEIKIYEYFDDYCIAAVRHSKISDRWVPCEFDYGHDYLVMLPEAICQGKPVYRGDTLYDENGAAFQFSPEHTQSMLGECTWEPVKKWPETTMGDEELDYEYRKFGLYGVANAAIAHACETGQVVPMEKVKEIVEFAKAQAEEYLPTKITHRRLWSNVSAEFFGGATLVHHKLEDK
jgi:hypothetical protein